MPILISEDLLLTLSEPTAQYGPNNGRIGIENISNITNIDEGINSAYTLPSNPAYFTSSTSTSERWKSQGAVNHYWACNCNYADVDYVGIAAHRGLIGKEIYIVASTGGPLEVLLPPRIVTREDPIIALFENINPFYLIIRISSSGDPFDIEIGNIYVGNSVVMPRPVYVNHTPITLGRKTTKKISVSDNGNFCGQAVTSISQKSSVSIPHIKPDYVRDVLVDKFQKPAETRPFFWAWSPMDYPLECGFCSTTNDVSFVNSSQNGRMTMSFDMSGYILNE